MTDSTSAVAATDSSELQADVKRIADAPAARRVWAGVGQFIRSVVYRLYRVEILNEDGLDVAGAVIYAPLHRSNLDAPIIGAATPRRVRVLSKQSLFANKAVRWLYSSLGAFPVERGAADRESMRIAISLLNGGDPLLVFPEGTRQSGNAVAEIFDGVAYLSAKSGAPVVPIALSGTEAALPPGARFPKRSTVTMVVGDPISPPVSETGRLTKSGRETFSEGLRVALQELFDNARDHSERRS